MKTVNSLALSAGILAALTIAAVTTPLAQAQGLATLTSSSAAYAYSAPTGAYTDISSHSGLSYVTLQTHDYGYDFPIQYTDGTHGTTPFDDSHWYGRTDNIAVPNITTTGGFYPSTGSDGHLVVVDTSTRTAYPFWRLCTDTNGTPITCSGNYSPTSIGNIKSFSLNTSNGAVDGATASGIAAVAGDILPGELNGAPVPHALLVVIDGALMSPNVCTEAPADNSDGSVSGAVFCEGAKIRMDPSVDVDSLSASAAAKSVMKALQAFGGIIVDQGGCSGCMAFYTNVASRPDLTGLTTNLLAHLWIYYGN